MKSGISNSLVVFAVLFFCTVIFFPAQSHSQASDSSAQANGFVFSSEGGRDYMYRFSFGDPSELRDRKIMDSLRSGSYTNYHLTFANRPWMFYFRWWRGSSFLVCCIDTATGGETVIDMDNSAGGANLVGLSYDKGSNSLYFLSWNDYSGNIPTENFLYRLKMSFHGDEPKNVLRFNDTGRFVTFTIGADGFGYAVNTHDELKKLNLQTGASYLVCKLNVKGKIRCSDFNPVDGRLYLLTYPDSLNTELVAVDIKTGISKSTAKWEGKYSTLAISGNVFPPPLGAPELVSPLGHIDDFEPTIVWKPVTGATGYFLNYRMMYDGVGHPWWNSKDVTETSYKVEKGIFDSSFPNYWWVAAYDSTGLGYFSPHAVTGSHVDEK